jgi:hypothetical protein
MIIAIPMPLIHGRAIVLDELLHGQVKCGTSRPAVRALPNNGSAFEKLLGASSPYHSGRSHSLREKCQVSVLSPV